MKKIPSLFKRDYEGNRQVYNEFEPGSQEICEQGTPTVKIDGMPCMVKDGQLFKRYDRKRNKNTGEHKSAPGGWIPCEDEPNEHTGHWPGWIPVDENNTADKWHDEAWQDLIHSVGAVDGTYELIGPKVQRNLYDLDWHKLVTHGNQIISTTNPLETFNDIREYLSQNIIEGIVWYHPDGRMCKIKRRDFGFDWPVK